MEAKASIDAAGSGGVLASLPAELLSSATVGSSVLAAAAPAL